MRPIMDVAVEPAREQSEFAGSALFREAAVEVADQCAFLMMGTRPERGAEAVSIGDGHFLDARINIAGNALDLRRGDPTKFDGVLKEALGAFGAARIGEP